jgi:hypothetical protein
MVTLPKELGELLEDKDAVKVLGTVDGQGIPHVVFKDSFTLLEDGSLAYAEDLDSSQSSKNMVRSIWFDKTVSVTVGKGEEGYQMKAKPVKCLITGPLFKEFLLRERERLGPDADIQAVWVISPLELRNQSRKVRREEERAKDPFYNIHLDRLRAEK